jgi:hypothetical protein
MSIKVRPMEMSKCPSQLKQRPGRLGVVERLELGRGLPVLGRQVAERLLDSAKFALEGQDGILI